MSESIQPEQPNPEIQPLSATQKPDVQAGMKETAAAVANVVGTQIDVLKNKPIIEEDLRAMRDQFYARKEIRGDGTTAPLPLAAVSALFLSEAAVECAQPTIDLPRTRVLMHLGYTYAKSLKRKNPEALIALKEWQTKLAAENPEAVKQLVDTYKQTIDAVAKSEQPDLIWMAQWIDLCTGFAPEVAAELAEKFQQATDARCEYFVKKIETELEKETPDLKVIEMNITVPPTYYGKLSAGSTIPERMTVLQERYEALKNAGAQ